MENKHLDSGFSWIIATLSCAGNILSHGILSSLSIYHILFMDRIPNNGSAQVALISSLCISTFSLISMLSGILSQRFGCRPVAMIGGCLSCLGLVLSSQAKNVYHLYFTFGIITGSGLGLHALPNLAIVGLYFKKYRSAAFGISSAGIGLGPFIFPSLIYYLESTYGWRGALLIIAGICLNLTVVGALFKPIEVCNSNAKDDRIPFYFHIFKNKSYLVLNIHACISWFSMTVINIHLGNYVRHLGYTKSDAALSVSISGIASTIGRMIWGALNQIPWISTCNLYFWPILTLGIVTVLVPMVEIHFWILTYAGLFGVLSGSYGPLMPQLISEALGVDLMGVGYGYQYTVTAVFIMGGGPIAGMLFDRSGAYSSSFYLAGVCFILASVMLIILWKMKKNSSDLNDSNLEQEIELEMCPLSNEQ